MMNDFDCLFISLQYELITYLNKLSDKLKIILYIIFEVSFCYFAVIYKEVVD